MTGKKSKEEAAASAEAAEGEAPISSLREKIDRTDAEILELLARRRDLSQEVARAKNVQRSPIRDRQREEQLLIERIHSGRKRGLDAHFVTRVFHEIIDDSIRLQQGYLQKGANEEDGEQGLIRVAFQGIEGAYSHLAAKRFFSKQEDQLVSIGLSTFADVIGAVERGQADYAMLPIENTTSGGINEVYDLLLHTRLSIVGEEKLRVEHCLVAPQEIALGSLRRIYSHPQAIAQCSSFLATLTHCQVEYLNDTAVSVSVLCP